MAKVTGSGKDKKKPYKNGTKVTKNATLTKGTTMKPGVTYQLPSKNAKKK